MSAAPTRPSLPKHSLATTYANPAPNKGSVEKIKVVSAADRDLIATVSRYTVKAVVMTPE